MSQGTEQAQVGSFWDHRYDIFFGDAMVNYLAERIAEVAEGNLHVGRYKRSIPRRKCCGIFGVTIEI